MRLYYQWTGRRWEWHTYKRANPGLLAYVKGCTWQLGWRSCGNNCGQGVGTPIFWILLSSDWLTYHREGIKFFWVSNFPLVNMGHIDGGRVNSLILFFLTQILQCCCVWWAAGYFITTSKVSWTINQRSDCFVEKKKQLKNNNTRFLLQGLVESHT